jgi:hydroxypyruvate isomerase
MEYSVCVDLLYFDLDYFGADPKNIIKGMNLAKEAGFGGIDFFNWRRKDIDTISQAKNKLKLEITALATDFINLCDPTLRASYLEALKESLEAAKRLDCKIIISQAGWEIEGVSREDQHKSLIKGLEESALILEETDVTLVVEPLNTLVDHPGYYLWSSKEGFQIIDEVGSPRIKLLYDMYHQQIMEGNLIANITKNIDKIGHLHAAGIPGRHEITAGEINYKEVFKAIENTGYQGYCGLEYVPTKDVLTGLKEAAALIYQ